MKVPTDSKSVSLSPYDLKSKESKYKRWSPRMDSFLVKLLSDVVHSYPREASPELTKKSWTYVCNQLRLANPQTVYSTYTKYSCLQHLYHVIHNRYKLWYTLMLHSHSSKHHKYSFRWNPNIGCFQIIVNSGGEIITDENFIKSIIYANNLPLPSLAKFHKGNLVANDFFLSNNFLFMSDYHNEILPMLIRLDPKFNDEVENVYEHIPKFEYKGFNQEYQKPLNIQRVKRVNGPSSPTVNLADTPHPLTDAMNNAPPMNAPPMNAPPNPPLPSMEYPYTTTIANSAKNMSSNSSLSNIDAHSTGMIHNDGSAAVSAVANNHNSLHPVSNSPKLHKQLAMSTPSNNRTNQMTAGNDMVDPAIRRRDLAALGHPQAEFENELTNVTMAAMNDQQTPGGANQQLSPLNSNPDASNYQKDRPWFNKLVTLHESHLITIEDFFLILDNFKENRIPMVLLNLLDPGSTSATDEEIARKTKSYIIPLCENFTRR